MTSTEKITRRSMLTQTATGLGAMALSGMLNPSLAASQKVGGRLKQSVCRWCYNKIPLDEFAKAVSEMGLKGIDLLTDPNDWPTAKKYGLIPTMVTGAGNIPDACNRKDLHDKLFKDFEENIARAAANGVPNVITFSGNRKGMSDGEGLENTVTILNRAKSIAEKHGVTICLEYLNSKVDHKDYMFRYS